MHPSTQRNLVVSLCASLLIAFGIASCGDNNPPQCQQTDDGCTFVPPVEDGGATDAGSDDAGVDSGVPCGTTFCVGATPVCSDPAAEQCVTCTKFEGCSGIAPICDLAIDGGSCIECTRNEDCPLIAPFCDTGSRLCMTADGGRPHAVDAGPGDSDGGTGDGGVDDGGFLGDGGALDGGGASDGGSLDGGFGTDGGNGDGGVAPSGETCADPIPVVFDGGTTSAFSIDTTSASNESNGTGLCQMPGGRNGPELVYSLTLTATKAVSITVTPTGSTTTDYVLYVRGSPCATGTQLGCSDNPITFNAPETVSFPSLAAGTYFLFFDTFATPGTADVSISVTP